MSLSLNDVLMNREKYPDTQEIDFGGQKTTLRTLREELMPKGEMTKATQKLSDEKRQLEQNVTDLQQAYQGLQGQLSSLVADRSKAAGGDPTRSPMAELEADPILGPVIAELKAVRSDLLEAKKSNEALQQRQMEMATHYIQDQYRARIARLQESDKTFDPKALIDFAVAHNMPDIELAHRVMTEDSRLKSAAAEAEKRGYEKGKTEVTIPPISTGRRMTVAPPPDGVTNLEQAKEAASNDPEIARMWNGV